MPLNRKVRYGMVGGGPGAFIGAVHRKAAALDGEIELVPGAFSSDALKSRRPGEFLRPNGSRAPGRAALPRSHSRPRVLARDGRGRGQASGGGTDRLRHD